MARLMFACFVCLMLAGCGAPAHPAMTAPAVLAAFKAAGLEAEAPVLMGVKDYGPAPFLCEGTHFFIPSLGPDNGGRLFICPNTVDRDKLATHYKELVKISAWAFSHVVVRDNVIYQINGNLDDATAKRYEDALNAMP